MRKCYLFLIIALLGGCSRQSPSPYATTRACGVLNPAKNLPWLRARIEDGIDVVTAITYNGETYIDLYAYHWSCRTCYVYSCDGRRVDIGQFSPADQQALLTRILSPDAQILYKRF